MTENTLGPSIPTVLKIRPGTYILPEPFDNPAHDGRFSARWYHRSKFWKGRYVVRSESDQYITIIGEHGHARLPLNAPAILPEEAKNFGFRMERTRNRKLHQLGLELQARLVKVSDETRTDGERSAQLRKYAPDLLAALKAMRSALRSMPDVDPFFHGPLATADSLAEIAISKAEDVETP